MKAQWKWGLFCCLVVSITLFATKLGCEVVSVMAEHRSITNQYCIVIDPGHGGEDGGAVSVSNLPESEYNLSIALRLKDLIHLLGYQTKMIRTEDISVYTSGETIAAKKISDLRQRVKLVEDTDDPILISIHQNTFPDSRYFGPQVFYPPRGQGAQLAERLQQALSKDLNPGSNRMPKRADGVYLMQHIQCPGVLIECGFISNPEEEAKLRNAQYQRKLCSVISSTVAKFLDG